MHDKERAAKRQSSIAWRHQCLCQFHRQQGRKPNWVQRTHLALVYENIKKKGRRFQEPKVHTGSFAILVAEVPVVRNNSRFSSSLSFLFSADSPLLLSPGFPQPLLPIGSTLFASAVYKSTAQKLMAEPLCARQGRPGEGGDISPALPKKSPVTKFNESCKSWKTGWAVRGARRRGGAAERRRSAIGQRSNNTTRAPLSR